MLKWLQHREEIFTLPAGHYLLNDLASYPVEFITAELATTNNTYTVHSTTTFINALQHQQHHQQHHVRTYAGWRVRAGDAQRTRGALIAHKNQFSGRSPHTIVTTYSVDEGKNFSINFYKIFINFFYLSTPVHFFINFL